MAKVRYQIAPAIFRTTPGGPSPGVSGRDNLGDTSFGIVTLDVADTISSVMMYLYRQGTPGTIRIGIQGVTQSSNNQGYVNNGTFLTYVDLTGTAISTSPSLQLFTFASPISLAAGTYAVVFKNESGTFNGSNRCIVASSMAFASSGYIGQIGGHNTSVTSVGDVVQSYCSMRGVLRTYGFPYATFGGVTVSTPNQVGNKIRLTANSAGYYDVSGIVSRTISTGTGSSHKIYDDTLTEIGSVSIPSNAGATQRVAEFYFTSLVRMYPDRDYYVVCAGTQQSNYYTLLAQSDNSAFTAHDFQYCNRATASGAFTLTSGRVAELGLIIEEQSPAYIPTERNASTITIAPASTSQSIELYLGATGLTYATSGLAAYYVRNQSAPVAITLVTQTPTGAWASGGFAEISSSLVPGVYRLDVPNAAFAANASDVTIVVRGAAGTNGAVLTVTLSSGGLTSAQTAAAVWDEPYTSHTTASTFGARTLLTTADNRPAAVGTSNHIQSNVHAIVDSTAAASELSGALLHNGTDYISADLLTPVSAATSVHIGPYQLLADGLGADQPLDVNVGTATSIDVQVTDANGTGIDITGATVSAKVYSSAGTLVATYAGTATYADNGRLSFGLTTTVTNTSGTYTVLVTRTTGATDTQIFGPLRLYVRPA